MKRTIQSILFIAVFIVALAMGGSEELGGIIGSFAVLVVIAAAMWKMGMIAPPISEEKYEQCYGKKKK